MLTYMATHQNLAKQNVQEVQKKNVSKQTGNYLFDTSIFAILVDLAFEI